MVLDLQNSLVEAERWKRGSGNSELQKRNCRDAEAELRGKKRPDAIAGAGPSGMDTRNKDYLTMTFWVLPSSFTR